MGAEQRDQAALSPRERLKLDYEQYWWLDLIEEGDPVWINFDGEDRTPIRFVGWAPESVGSRAGQPVITDHSAPSQFNPNPRALKMIAPCFLLPVPPSVAFFQGREPTATREWLLEVWAEVGLVPAGGTMAQALDEGVLWE